MQPCFWWKLKASDDLWDGILMDSETRKLWRSEGRHGKVKKDAALRKYFGMAVCQYQDIIRYHHPTFRFCIPQSCWLGIKTRCNYRGSLRQHMAGWESWHCQVRVLLLDTAFGREGVSALGTLEMVSSKPRFCVVWSAGLSRSHVVEQCDGYEMKQYIIYKLINQD